MFGAFLSPPGFQLSQKLALEAARFSAQRLRAYADQMEKLARCSNPADLVALQTAYFTRLQEEYAAETDAVQRLLATNGEGGAEA